MRRKYAYVEIIGLIGMSITSVTTKPIKDFNARVNIRLLI